MSLISVVFCDTHKHAWPLSLSRGERHLEIGRSVVNIWLPLILLGSSSSAVGESRVFYLRGSFLARVREKRS